MNIVSSHSMKSPTFFFLIHSSKEQYIIFPCLLGCFLISKNDCFCCLGWPTAGLLQINWSMQHKEIFSEDENQPRRMIHCCCLLCLDYNPYFVVKSPLFTRYHELFVHQRVLRLHVFDVIVCPGKL